MLIKGNELPIFETLVDGVYTRSIFIPGDSYVLGASKKRPYTTVVSKGEVIIEENGAKQVRIAPTLFESAPNVRRRIYAATSAVLVTIHRTDVTNIEDVPADVLSPEELPLLERGK